MKEMERLLEVVEKLRAPDGCPWDREQTHGSLKAACVEEAAEVVCGINILEKTGSAENLKEELGDLLLQVVMHAQIAKEEGLFDLEDVAKTISDKMIRRHPHVFGEAVRDITTGEVLADGEASPDGEALKSLKAATGSPKQSLGASWEEIKKQEKAGREWEADYLPGAMDEASELLEVAKKRKGF